MTKKLIPVGTFLNLKEPDDLGENFGLFRVVKEFDITEVLREGKVQSRFFFENEVVKYLVGLGLIESIPMLEIIFGTEAKPSGCVKVDSIYEYPRD